MKSRVASSPTASAQRRHLPGEVLGIGLGGAARHGPRGLHPVAVGLPVLRQQDQRRRVGRLRENARLSRMNG